MQIRTQTRRNMRKLFIYMVILCLVSCEVIPEGERLIELPVSFTGERTHVLIEYTGFRCVNCPKAAETAHELQSLYGERLIVVAMHPASNPFTQGLYDYTCPAADSIYRWMGGTASTPFPTGNINMVATDGSYFMDPTEWPAALSHAMEDTVVNLSAFRKSYWLVEDSVPGVQAMPDGSVNTNYYHRHVLRAVSDEANMTIPDGCNREHCRIVELYLDNNDKHIIQAYEKKLTSSGFMPPIYD